MNFQEAEKKFKTYLSKQNMFYTKERALILNAVLHQSGHFSVDELDFAMQKGEKKASRATLYRSISNLVDAGILLEADFGHGHVHYELADSTPHEHMVCKECGKIFEVNNPKLLKAIESIALENKFLVNSHKTVIFGTCHTCQTSD